MTATKGKSWRRGQPCLVCGTPEVAELSATSQHVIHGCAQCGAHYFDFRLLWIPRLAAVTYGGLST